jgi:hypothetical protein
MCGDRTGVGILCDITDECGEYGGTAVWDVESDSDW